MHLREGTTWDSVVAGNGDSKAHKIQAIEGLLKAYPQRSFILIGDSGEADPEIYAHLMRQYPTQILFIAIRDVTQQNRDAPRYQHTFKEIDTKRWSIFTDPSTVDIGLF